MGQTWKRHPLASIEVLIVTRLCPLDWKNGSNILMTCQTNLQRKNLRHNGNLRRWHGSQEQRKEGPHDALQESFDLLRKYSMKLNMEKWTFELASEKFLGYMVTKQGIEANPDQIKAILEIRSPRTIKERKILTGRAAVLSRFISRSTDICKPFFTAIKKKQGTPVDRWMRKGFHKTQGILCQTFTTV